LYYGVPLVFFWSGWLASAILSFSTHGHALRGCLFNIYLIFIYLHLHPSPSPSPNSISIATTHVVSGTILTALTSQTHSCHCHPPKNHSRHCHPPRSAGGLSATQWHACSEVRAAALSGDCAFPSEARRGNVRFGGGGEACVRGWREEGGCCWKEQAAAVILVVFSWGGGLDSMGSRGKIGAFFFFSSSLFNFRKFIFLSCTF
jgi:hypothetical protein